MNMDTPKFFGADSIRFPNSSIGHSSDHNDDSIMGTLDSGNDKIHFRPNDYIDSSYVPMQGNTTKISKGETNMRGSSHHKEN